MKRAFLFGLAALGLAASMGIGRARAADAPAKPADAIFFGNVAGDDATRIDDRAQKLLAQMTQDEKIGMLGGTNWFYTVAIPRLGIPSLKMMDGPVGTRND